MIIVPLSPATAWFLTPEERMIAVKRVASEHASGEHSNFSWPQAYATFKDPKVCYRKIGAHMIHTED